MMNFILYLLECLMNNPWNMIRPQFLFWWPNDKKSKKRKSKLKTISEALIFCFCVYHLRAHFGTPTDLIGPVLMRKEYIPFALGVLLESYQCRVETQLVRVRMFPLKKKQFGHLWRNKLCSTIYWSWYHLKKLFIFQKHHKEVMKRIV